MQDKNRQMTEEITARNKSVQELEELLHIARSRLADLEPDYKKTQIAVRYYPFHREAILIMHLTSDL